MAAPSSASSSSIFNLKNTHPPDDTVFYSIFLDCSSSADELQSLHIQILRHIAPHTGAYIWQHQPFSLFITLTPVPHLSGHLRFGDNLDDEWLVVYLLFRISKAFPNLSIRAWDSDGEFLLIESAFHLPKWLDPDTSANRVFIRRGLLHIIPKTVFPSPPALEDSLRLLAAADDADSFTRASEAVQSHLSKKIGEYPDRAYRNVHMVRVRLPVSVAWVLSHEPSLISSAVEGFYDRDIDSMKCAAKMEKFLPAGKAEEMVDVAVRMSRAMYAQLVQQKFQAPGCFPMPERGNVGKYMEAELGMKIACGFEMMYQLRKKQGGEGKGSTWEAFRESLESSDYFKGLLPGSKEYTRLMENAEGYYQSSSLHARAREVLSAPIKRIDELLGLSHSADNFKYQELPPSDDDSWLYGGEEELNAALQDRQNEMETYNAKHKKKHKSKEKKEEEGSTSGKDFEECDLGGIAKSMQAFVKKMSSYEGAEVPVDRNLKDVNFDADQFMKDMETVMGKRDSNDNDSDLDLDEGLSSYLDSDNYEDDSEHSEDNEEGGDKFMRSYSDALNKELKATTLDKTFVHAQEQSSKTNDEGTSTANDEMDEFTPVDVDINLVKNFLDSYSSQEGLAGPASNLLGLMGLRLPDDVGKDSWPRKSSLGSSSVEGAKENT